MLPDQEEAEAVRYRATRKIRKLVQKGENITNSDLFDLCTLNILRDAATKELITIKEDKTDGR